MVVEFKLPDPGEGISEGNVVKWRVKEGDSVKEHEIIADLETDKAVIEIPSPVSGIIKKLHFNIGDTVEVGQVLVTIDDGSGSGPSEEKFKDRSVAVVGELEEAPDEEEISKHAMHPKTASAARPHAVVKALPIIRKFAEKMNVDIEKITGTGPEGMITEKDVKKAALLQAAGMKSEEPAPDAYDHPDYKKWGEVEIVPVKGIRKVTAEHMARSEHTAVHVSHFEEVNVTKLGKYRDKAKIKAKEKGIKLTYLPFIVKAALMSLKSHPYLNASLDDNKQEILVKKYYNIGIAVDAPDGLIVPNIKNADRKSIEEIAREIVDLAGKAKERKLTLEEMKGGTFTITNIGALGGTHATPIINYPESAILGLGAIREKPIVENGKVVIAKILPISVTFDHKILDGAECARFANDLKKYLENHKSILDEDKNLPKESEKPEKQVKSETPSPKDDVLEGIL